MPYCALLCNEPIHHVEKSHKCNYCEKAFLTSAKCLTHERVHTRERPWGLHSESQEARLHTISSFLLESGHSSEHRRIHASHMLCLRPSGIQVLLPHSASLVALALWLEVSHVFSTSVHHTWHAARTRTSMKIKKIAVLLYGHHSWDHTWMDSSPVLMWFKSKLHLGGYVLSDHDKYMSMPHARGRETVQIGTAWYMDITPLFSGQQRGFSHRGGALALLEQVLQVMLAPRSKNCHYLESYSIRVVELESIWWTLFIYSIFMVNSMLFSCNLCIHWMHSFRVENCSKKLF